MTAFYNWSLIYDSTSIYYDSSTMISMTDCDVIRTYSIDSNYSNIKVNGG